MAVGYKLADDYNRAGPVRFGGVPGVWSKGEAVAIETLGVSEKDMDAHVKDGDLPLVKVKNAPKADGEPLDLATPPPDDEGGK